MDQGSDLYSSTSSDDQSSINSVIHVENVLEAPECDTDTGPNSSHRQKQNNHTQSDSDNGEMLDDTFDSTSESEEDGDQESLLRTDEISESDSSSTSEETQIWVPVKARGNSKPVVPPKPTNRHSGTFTCNTPVRHSLVSQNSSSGRIETSLLPHDVCTSADSGVRNEIRAARSFADNSVSHVDSFCDSNPSQSQSSHLSRISSPPHSSACSPSIQSSHSSQPQSVQYQCSPSHNANSCNVIALTCIPSARTSHRATSLKIDDRALPEDEAEMMSYLRESLFNILSGLYAIFLVTLGLALPVAEVFAVKITKGLFEGFYIYLFVVSVLFLLYVYLFLLRTHTNSLFRTRMHSSSRHQTSLLTKSPAMRRKVSMSAQSHTGSFYLRLGAVGFGVGAMIHEGLKLGELFEQDWGSACLSLAQAIRPVAHLIFTFVQLYFIFLNSKMCIHRYRVFARFGLMHMVATNLCLWGRTVIDETIRVVTEHAPQNLPSQNGHLVVNVTNAKTHGSVRANNPHAQLEGVTIPGPSNSTAVIDDYPDSGHILCHQPDIMRNVVQAASPYLYPCSIEYSLIAAGILYVMWRNISKPPEVTSSEEARALEEKKKTRVSVDCAGANRGLFFGIFTLVSVIISMIVFFVLIDKPAFVQSAVMIVYISELVLYSLATVAVCFAAFSIRDMRFHRRSDHQLDEILLVASLTGVYSFCLFSIIASAYSDGSCGGCLITTTSILILLQATLQTVFILNGLRRSSRKPQHERRKPGREYITFLLVSNIGMWGINTFEVLRSTSNPVALGFYGILPWTIITHLSSPLAIFFRFHSTACLAMIWKNAYKQKAQ